MISLAAALRSMTPLSSEPVDFKVCCSPLAIIKTAVKTNTTKAKPMTVTAVVIRRDSELRKIYLKGICIFCALRALRYAHCALPHMPEAFDDSGRED
jgi:hypothetical protein